MDTPIIAVTGAIASGKTTVAGVIAADGGSLLNADNIANEVLEEKGVKEKIIREFGNRVIDGSGLISRRRLGDIVFYDYKKLKNLNRLIYPYVKRRIDEEVLNILSKAKYIVLDAVLYFQYKFDFKVDFVVVTKADENVRIERLINRDGIETAKAKKIIEAQRPLYDDWEAGNVIINTDCHIDKMKSIAEQIRNNIFNNNTD